MKLKKKHLIFIVTSQFWLLPSTGHSQDQTNKTSDAERLNSIIDFSLYPNPSPELLTDLRVHIHSPKQQVQAPDVVCSQPYYQRSHQKPYQLPHVPLDNNKFEKKFTQKQFVEELRRTDAMIKQAWGSANVDFNTRRVEIEQRNLLTLAFCLSMSFKPRDNVSFFDECLNSDGLKKDTKTIASCNNGWLIRRSDKLIYIFILGTTFLSPE